MRLAGTISMYSKKAMPQLVSAAISQGLPFRLFRWPYQAKVMKRLEQQSRAAVCNQTGMMGVGSK